MRQTGGAHNGKEETANNIKDCVVKALEELSKMSEKELQDDRYDKFRRIGCN